MGCGGGSSSDPAPKPTTPVVEADWPNLFGPAHNTSTTERVDYESWGPVGPPEVWRREVGDGYSSPVVANGLVVVLHREGDEEVVEAFDATTGEMRWEHRYPTTFECPYDYSNGPYGTPTIYDGRVYTFGGQWQARCLDLADGRVVWRRELAEDYEPATIKGFPYGAGPWVDDQRVVINIGAADAGIVALDRATGETLWTATDHKASYATPRYAEPQGLPTLYFFTFEGVVALDPEDGAVRWFQKHRPGSPLSVNATTPVVWGDHVLAVTGPGPGAICFRTEPEGDFEIVWRDRRVIDSQFNTLMPVGDYVYGYTSSRNLQASLRCVELETGELKWNYQSELKRGTGIVAEDKLLLWGEAGHLAVVDVDPKEPRVRYFSEEPLIEAPTYSTPALARGLLYLRNEGNLVCYRARPAEPKP